MARIRELSPGVWEVTVSAGRDPVTGRWRQRTRRVRTGATRPHTGKEPPRAVKTAAAELQVEVGDSKATATNVTVARLFADYLRHAEARGRAPKTILEYRRIATDLEQLDIGTLGQPWPLGQVPLARLTARDIDLALLVLAEQGAGADRRPLSETTRHHYFALLRQALNQAVAWDWIGRNPTVAVDPPALAPAERNPPPPEDVQRLAASLAETNPDLGALILLAALTGCRRGELCGLRWDDVDLPGRVIRVTGAVSDLPYAKGGPQRRQTKTKRSRPVDLDDLAAGILGAQRLRAEQRCAAVGAALTGNCYVWSQAADHRTFWRPGRVTSAFAVARRQVGLEHVRFQDLRHWAATRLMAANIDVKTIAARMGHSERVLLATYSHHIPARNRAAAEVLGALLALPAPVGE